MKLMYCVTPYSVPGVGTEMPAVGIRVTRGGQALGEDDLPCEIFIRRIRGNVGQRRSAESRCR